MPHRVPHPFQSRRALLRHLAPHYQQASHAQKTLLLDSFVEWTGYSRKYAIELLNHGKHGQETIQRRRLPRYGPAVQQALFLAWKATHYVCAKRLLPSLPSLVAVLEAQGRLRLTEEERRQLLAMSGSTAERFLRTQRKPRMHGLSTTTPGPWRKSQIPVRIFSQWEEDRPGFVEMDLVAHCGEHLEGSFLYTLTLTDLDTGWTECIPLLYKSANTVLAALEQARTLFPFPRLRIDTDSGSEFLNAELIAYCEREHLTFTRGRPAVKNDQCHVEQKNGAVVREAVGHARLVGEQAYYQLREVYRALRLVVNCFQPSLKLQAKVPQGEQVRRVYDAAQTPLQRLLASGVLSQTRQRELSKRVEQVDPLATRVNTSMSCGAPCCVEPTRPLQMVRESSCRLCSAFLWWPVPPGHCRCPRKGPHRLATAKTPGHQNSSGEITPSHSQWSHTSLKKRSRRLPSPPRRLNPCTYHPPARRAASRGSTSPVISP